MKAEKYSIQVNENSIVIDGFLTIREVFDHLNYFDREGYVLAVPNDHNTTFTLVKEKIDLSKEFPNSDELHVTEKNIYESFYEEVSAENKRLKDTITQMYSLLKFITECKEEEKINGLD